jgi:hypothetical protein
VVRLASQRIYAGDQRSGQHADRFHQLHDSGDPDRSRYLGWLGQGPGRPGL